MGGKLRITTLVTLALLVGCSAAPEHLQPVQQSRAPSTAPAPNDTAAAFELTILHINDHHSQLDPDTVKLPLDTGGSVREHVAVEAGGFARLAQAIEEIAQTRPHVIKVHAGDAITGDLYYPLSQGAADATAMNQVCFDTFTLGNHEFDDGDAGLRHFLDLLGNGNCSTTVLSANVRFGPTSPLKDAHDTGLVRRSVVLERGDERIGIVGLTIAHKTKQSSRPNPDTLFISELTAAQDEIDHLRAQGVNKIVLQTHIGYGNDLTLARALRGVDVIVGGDSHSLLGPPTLGQYGIDPVGPYPTEVQNAEGDRTCVVQAFQYSKVLGELHVGFDEDGRVTYCRGTPHLLVGSELRRVNNQPLSPEETASALNDLASSGVFRVTDPHPAVVAALQPFREQKQAYGASTVATAAMPLCQRRVPGPIAPPALSALDAACNADSHVIAHGGDVQQLMAEALLHLGARYFDAQISLQNAGGVRVSLPPGPITVEDVYTLLPFDNEVVRLSVTGAELKRALEEALEAILARRATGSYPYAAGLRWQVDYTRPRGSRVNNLQVRNPDGQWVALEPDTIYHVATIGFLADGKDDYTTFATITGERRLDVGLSQTQAFLDYLKSLPGDVPVLTRPKSENFSTQHFIPPAL